MSAKTDEHPVFLLDELHAQPALATIAPRRIGQRRQDFLRPHFADAFEVFDQHVLFGGDLRGGIEMLQRAAAANAEMRAQRRYAIRRWTQHFFDHGLVVVTALAGETQTHTLTRERAIDEHGFAGDVRDTAAFVSEIGDIRFENGHAIRRPAKRSQSGRGTR
jgi:hypothetical protein